MIGDSNVAYNGIYRKSGASGSGSWTRIADLPYSVVYAQNAGAGTANAIVATSSVPISTAAYSQLISIPFATANTGAMTISINGETPRMLVLNTGGAVPTGYVKARMAALVQIDGDGNYRLFSYGDASAIQAAAEAAANRAEIAAASVGNAKIFDSHGDADGATIDSSIAYARTAGFGSAGDGGGADFVLIDSDPSMPGQWSPADGRFAELVPAPRYKPSPFGILPEDDGAAALINDVFSWLTARRGGGIIELLPESYYATETISPKSGCAFVGAGGAGQYPRVANAESANFKALEKTRILARPGFTGSMMVNVSPANSALYCLQGVRLGGLMLDCASIVNRGLDWISVKNSSVRDLLVYRPKAYGIRENVLSDAAVVTEGQNDTQFNSWEDITVWATDSNYPNVIGVETGGTVLSNVNQNYRRNYKIVHRDGVGVNIANADTDVWTGLNTAALGSGFGLVLQGSNTDAALSARDIMIYGAQLSNSGTTGGGGMDARGGTASPSLRNVVLGYSLGNNSPLPIVRSGAVLTVITDSGQYIVNGSEVIGSGGEVYGGRHIVPATANTNLAATDNGALFTNAGATGNVAFGLPMGTLGMRFGFMSLNSNGIYVIAQPGAAIRIGGSVSSTNRRARTTTTGDVLWLTAMNPTAWIAENPDNGGWVLD